jgi:hypothetical protein
MNGRRMVGPTKVPLHAGNTAVVRDGGAPPQCEMAAARRDLVVAVDSGQKGTTMRPLDGGVLSLGRARTPARGRGGRQPSFSGRLGWPSSPASGSPTARCGAERGKGRRNEMIGLGFSGAAARFCSAEIVSQPSDRS